MSKLGKRILVAENDDAARDILGALLVQAGYNVHATKDGREALTEMQRKHFDVVVTDCDMPHLDGRELLSLSRPAWPHLPIIMLSKNAPEPPDRVQQLGAYAWVTKPYDTWFLMELIRDAANQTTEKNSSPVITPPEEA